MKNRHSTSTPFQLLRSFGFIALAFAIGAAAPRHIGPTVRVVDLLLPTMPPIHSTEVCGLVKPPAVVEPVAPFSIAMVNIDPIDIPSADCEF